MTAKINYNLERKVLPVEAGEDRLIMAKQGDRLEIRPVGASALTIEVKDYLDVRVYGSKRGKGGSLKISELGKKKAFYNESMKPGSTVIVQYDSDSAKTTDVAFE